jgi:hypothetical protein
MDNRVLIDFLGHFNPPELDKITSPEGLIHYQQVLQLEYRRFIERIRKNCDLYSIKGSSPDFYLKGLKAKLKDHKDELFDVRGDNVIYRHNKTTIVIPCQKGDLLSEASNLQYTYFSKAYDFLTSLLSDSGEMNSQRIKSPEKKQRFHYGFTVKNPNNLPRAYDLLNKKDQKLIFTNVLYSIFEKNFTGKQTKNKITWIESENCLHYFIDGIYGKPGGYGIGIEIEEGGQWEKAAQVFEKEDGFPFDSEDLSHAARKPTESQIKALNAIILQMNKPTKKQ